MIRNKSDYYKYLKEDKIALGVSEWTVKRKIVDYIAPHFTYKFQRKLRKLEYYKNCKNGLINKSIYWFLRIRFRKYSLKLGFSIPENVFGSGLAIVHTGTIIVHPNARIGKNCRLQACTNIGASGGKPEAPIIGDNVYIGPGAKIYGNITIASNCAIAANAAVGKSFFEEGKMIGGVPAKILKDIEIKQIIPFIT